MVQSIGGLGLAQLATLPALDLNGSQSDLDLTRNDSNPDDKKVGARQRRVLTERFRHVGQIAPERVDGYDDRNRGVVRSPGENGQDARQVACGPELVLEQSDRHEQAKVASRSRVVPGQSAHRRDTTTRNLEQDLLDGVVA